MIKESCRKLVVTVRDETARIRKLLRDGSTDSGSLKKN